MACDVLFKCDIALYLFFIAYIFHFCDEISLNFGGLIIIIKMHCARIIVIGTGGSPEPVRRLLPEFGRISISSPQSWFFLMNLRLF